MLDKYKFVSYNIVIIFLEVLYGYYVWVYCGGWCRCYYLGFVVLCKRRYRVPKKREEDRVKREEKFEREQFKNMTSSEIAEYKEEKEMRKIRRGGGVNEEFKPCEKCGSLLFEKLTNNGLTSRVTGYKVTPGLWGPNITEKRKTNNIAQNQYKCKKCGYVQTFTTYFHGFK